MPELPEVETVVRGLSRHLIGQTIKDVEVRNKNSYKVTSLRSRPRRGRQDVQGLKIVKISRRGKGIIINLTKDISLLIHLKMTGQLIYVPRTKKRSFDSAQDDKVGARNDKVKGWDDGRMNFGHPTSDFTNTMPSSHTRVIFKLSKGTLYFNDQRKFGWIKALPTGKISADSFIKKLGVEPFSKAFAPTLLWQATQRRKNSPIKAILMDQEIVAGMGNIYADEALFLAKIRPTRKGKDITQSEAKKLLSAIRKVLTLGIKHSGSSIGSYKTTTGAPGKMQNYLKVYDQTGKPCFRCKGKVERIKIAGRSAHFCPSCQK